MNFKHLRLAPHDTDAIKLRRDLDGFLATAICGFFGVDYSSLSMSTLIRHRRTRNWLQRAEEALENGDCRQCVEACAVTAHVFQRHRDRTDDSRREGFGPRCSVNSADLARLAGEISKHLQDEMVEVREQLELPGVGVRIADYRRFQDLRPHVYPTGDGRVAVQPRKSIPPSLEGAQFCLGFVRTVVLKLQEQYTRPNLFAPRGGTSRYVTRRATPLLVEPPSDKGPSEEIETVEKGVELQAYGDQRFDRPGYLAVLHQGDCAFVALDAVHLSTDPPQRLN